MLIHSHTMRTMRDLIKLAEETVVHQVHCQMSAALGLQAMSVEYISRDSFASSDNTLESCLQSAEL